MKRILIGIMSIFGLGVVPACSQSPAPARSEHETSMNFDAENVGPFLARLNEKLGLGLDVPKLARFTTSTKVEDERMMQVTVRFSGRSVQLSYRVFMDDVDAPDLYFSSDSAALVSVIDAELLSFAEEKGI